MKISPKNLRIVLVVIYLLLAVGAFGNLIYWGFGMLYAAGWAGSSMSIPEVAWALKGVVMLLLFAMAAGIGLIRPRKIGLLFGYGLTMGVGCYVLYNSIRSIDYHLEDETSLELVYVLEQLLGLLIVILIFRFFVWALFRIDRHYFNLAKADYTITFGLALVLFLSWYFMLHA